jgi:hypothetical protein
MLGSRVTQTHVAIEVSIAQLVPFVHDAVFLAMP